MPLAPFIAGARTSRLAQVDVERREWTKPSLAAASRVETIAQAHARLVELVDAVVLRHAHLGDGECACQLGLHRAAVVVVERVELALEAAARDGPGQGEA